jgi:methylthioribose-1-phosphate isomerase
MKFSPLFWPIKLKDRTIYILDESLLPHKLKYLKARDYKQAVAAIKQMKTRAVGQVLLVMYTFLLEARKNHSLAHFKKVSQAICASRPTLSFKYLTDMVLAWLKSGRALEKNIPAFLERLKHKRIQQAKDTARLIKDKDVILTHCNISGQMPLIAQFCRQKKKKISFFVTETRPYLQGARLTAWELRRQGFEVTLITDSMVAAVMSQGKISKVIVGADNLAQNGDIANKVGTYQIAVVARHFHIPFYVLCPPASRARTGAEIKIEIRPAKEMLQFDGRPIAAKGVRGYYPAFDITPNRLITKHIYLKV